ncbi:Choline-sulfatase [Rosistilla carotiformis]|uniref:Choline-sulfatase n=1 Tax=Rosistilla carotiformis TaxID=2528017 RepID=A0A518JQI4_9BACT|nr:sulfatase [Rosistilla carotiformis]QDV67802.1 Choline-sulfatase [Rosistilla carotiformis]
MARIQFPFALTLATCLMSAAIAVGGDRPNVLLICVDDLKPTIGCYGDPVAVTPNIDALASRGVRFDAAYCNQAVCSPSRNSLMTGLRPQTIGVYDLGTHFRHAAPDAITFSQFFKQHGYRAEGLGKIYHTGHGNLDDKASWSVASWRPKAAQYVQPESLQNHRPDSKGRNRGPATEAADVSDETYADGKIARETIARLTAASKRQDQPFFLAVGFIKPHLPFVAPQKYWDLYQPDALPMPEVVSPPKGAPSYAPSKGGELRSYSDMHDKKVIDPQTTRHLIHGYYAATSYADAQIGRVIDKAQQLGLLDNTIVVLWGDHGWHLGDHGMWCKHSNYEQAARIPLIVAAPKSQPGLVSNALVETVDIYPTVAQLAGLPEPQGIDGISFASLINEPTDATRDHVTHVYPRGSRLGRAIRDSRYRLVQWKAPGGKDATAELELYDYQTDPLETKNVASENPEVVARMLELLAKQPEVKRQWKAKGKPGANSNAKGSPKAAGKSKPANPKAKAGT